MCVCTSAWGEVRVRDEGRGKEREYECEWLSFTEHLLHVRHHTKHFKFLIFFNLHTYSKSIIFTLYIRCSWLLFPNTTTATSPIPHVLLTMWLLTLVLLKGRTKEHMFLPFWSGWAGDSGRSLGVGHEMCYSFCLLPLGCLLLGPGHHAVRNPSRACRGNV